MKKQAFELAFVLTVSVWLVRDCGLQAYQITTEN
jgi:hypothetical protein